MQEYEKINGSELIFLYVIYSFFVQSYTCPLLQIASVTTSLCYNYPLLQFISVITDPCYNYQLLQLTSVTTSLCYN